MLPASRPKCEIGPGWRKGEVLSPPSGLLLEAKLESPSGVGLAGAPNSASESRSIALPLRLSWSLEARVVMRNVGGILLRSAKLPPAEDEESKMSDVLARVRRGALPRSRSRPCLSFAACMLGEVCEYGLSSAEVLLLSSSSWSEKDVKLEVPWPMERSSAASNAELPLWHTSSASSPCVCSGARGPNAEVRVMRLGPDCGILRTSVGQPFTADGPAKGDSR